ARRQRTLSGISTSFLVLSQAYRQVAHVLLTHPPLDPQGVIPKESVLLHALDLHVLGTPPAFVLSQDQTLHNIVKISKDLYNRYVYFLRSEEHTSELQSRFDL